MIAPVNPYQQLNPYGVATTERQDNPYRAMGQYHDYDQKTKSDRQQLEELQMHSAMEISQLTEKISRMEREKMDLYSKYMHLDSLRGQWEVQRQTAASVSDLQMQLDREKAERQRLEKELVQFPGQLFSLQKQLEDERRLVQELRQQVLGHGDISSQLANLKLERESIQARSSVTESSLALATQQLNDVNRKLEQAEFQLQRQEKELVSTKKLLDDANLVPPQLYAEIANLTEQLKTIHKQKEEEKRQLCAQYEAQLQAIQYQRSVAENHSIDVYTRNEYDATKPPPPAPSVPRNVDPELWGIYVDADPYLTQKLDAKQLEKALSNGAWPPLALKTCIFLIRSYDRTNDMLTFNLFEAVWKLVMDFKLAFAKFDKTRINEYEWGHIEYQDLKKALQEAGLVVSQKIMDLFQKRSNPNGQTYGWDQFVQAGARIKVWASEFERVDHDKDKCVTVLYDQYMDMVCRCQP